MLSAYPQSRYGSTAMTRVAKCKRNVCGGRVACIACAAFVHRHTANSLASRYIYAGFGCQRQLYLFIFCLWWSVHRHCKHETMDVNIELQPDVDDQNLDAALTAAADAVGDDMAGMPGLDDMPSLEDDNGMPSLEESSTNSPPTQHISGASGALPAELANGGAASLLLPSEVMNPQNLAGIRQHFNPNNMMKMRDQMKFMNPQMIMQMQQSLKKMTPQQRMAMQQQMRTVAQNLPPGEFDEIQRIAKENAQVLLKAQETGESKESIASKMQLPAMQKPKAAVPQKSGHGHSHGGKECGHDHGKPQNSFTELLKKDTAAVIKAAKADLNRKFVQKSHIVYECPRCSLEAPATYPMVRELMSLGAVFLFVS